MLESTGDVSEPLLFRILPGGIKTVGRAPRADFVVDAPLVSRLHCRLTVQDDGAGFSPADRQARRREGHVGLSLLEELATTVGGQLDVDSAPGKGTTFTLVVPGS